MTNPAKDDEALVRAVSEELQLAGCPAPDPDAAYAEKQRDFEDFARVAITAVRAHDAERGMVTVPAEPSEGAIRAGGSALVHPSVYMGGPPANAMRQAARAYSAMIAAAKPDGDAARDMTAAERLRMERETKAVHRAFDAVFAPRHSQWKGDE